MSRSEESAMDFQWENKSGPVDLASPFMTLATAAPRQRSDSLAKKRSFSDFNSPIKPNAFPNLRQPAPQQTFLFHQPPASPTKQLPPLLFSKNPAFNTPRKFETDYDSSGIENPSSPENNADSEATPDNMGFRSRLMRFGSTVSQTLENQKEKRHPALSRLGRSPGKREIARIPYSHSVEKRRLKSRKKDGEKRLAFRKNSSATDTEDDDASGDTTRQDKAQRPAGPGRVASLFGFIETHPDLPHILSFYAQLLLNVFLVFFFIYIIYSFWSTIRSDVDKKSEEAITDILAEMAICAQNYRENRCEKDTRMPALEAVCNNWERCMNKDPRSVGRARVSAHTFAEIFNSFVEPISYKAMIFSLIMVFGCVAVSNFAFGFFRNKAHPPPPLPAYMETPQRHYSGQHYDHNGYLSPMAHEPAPSMRVSDAHSPVRRLRYG